jgi:hypothetical protein
MSPAKPHLPRALLSVVPDEVLHIRHANTLAGDADSSPAMSLC